MANDMIGLTEIFVVLGSLLTTYFLIPKIVGISRHKQLMDSPNSRSSHKVLTPNLGGVAFFVSMMVSIYFFQYKDPGNLSFTLIPCLTILFVVGLKDDLMGVAPRTKFMAQFIVAFFLVGNKQFVIPDLHGFGHVHLVPFWVTLVLIPLIIVAIVNAINLIDGVDGLAASVGIVALSGLALLFYKTGLPFRLMLSLSMIGCLLGFLPHNLRGKNKIFMGDTGSLIVGFVISFLVLSALTMTKEQLALIPLVPSNLPILLVFFLFVPVFDTLRIMTVRIIKGRSPFRPDRIHLHHFFLFRKGKSHTGTTLTISFLSIVFVCLGFVMCNWLPYWVNLIFFAVVYGVSVLASLNFIERAKGIRKPTIWQTLAGTIRSLF